jgi:competence protein ComEC
MCGALWQAHNVNYALFVNLNDGDLDPALLVAGAMLVAAACVLVPWACVPLLLVVVGGAWAGVLRFRVRLITCFFVAVSLVSTMLRLRAMKAESDRRYAHAMQVFEKPAPCWFVGTVVSMPKVRRVLTADLLVDTLDCEGLTIALGHGTRIRVYDLPADAARGDRIEGVAQLAIARRSLNEGLSDGMWRVAQRGVTYSGSMLTANVRSRSHSLLARIDRLRGSARGVLRSKISAKHEPIMRALVLGEEDLDAEEDASFRASGTVHLLAVSGSHVALVVAAIVAVLHALLKRSRWLLEHHDIRRIAACIALVVIAVYEQFSGDSGSARRASVMAACVLLAQALGRRASFVRAAALSVVLIVGFDPMAAFDASFQLSLFATWGVVVVAPRVQRVFDKAFGLTNAWLSKSLGVSLGASMACTPWIASLGGQVSVVGVLANVVAVPVGEILALPLALATTGFGLFEFAASRGPSGVLVVLRVANGVLAEACIGAAKALSAIATFASSLRWATVSVLAPSAWQLGVVAALLLCFVGLRMRARSRIAACLVALAACLLGEFSLRFHGAPKGVLRITVVDVGQGDATLIDFPDGTLMLIDGGGEVGSSYDPGRSVLVPMLSHRRRSAVDIMVLSHPHPDHFGGLKAVAEAVSVRSFWHSGRDAEGPMRAPFHAMMQSVRASKPIERTARDLCGARSIGGVRLEVLHPCLASTHSMGANDGSLVMRLAYGAHSALLVGDAEHEAESLLLETVPRETLHSTFLKVGHHGSRTSSSSAFLAAVRPQIGSISCGIRNRYAHPNPMAVQRLASASVHALRTDRVGSIVWQTDGTHWKLQTAHRD